LPTKLAYILRILHYLRLILLFLLL